MTPKFLRSPGTHLAIHAHLSRAYAAFLITASGFAAFVFRTQTTRGAARALRKLERVNASAARLW